MKSLHCLRAIGVAFALLFAPPMLTGCSAVSLPTWIVPATTGSVSDVIPAAMNDAKQALAIAHTSHKGVAVALTHAVAAGWLVPGSDVAITARKWLDESEAILVAADKLVALGDARGIEAKISAASALIAQVQGIIGGSP